jgi:hypothetical protein
LVRAAPKAMSAITVGREKRREAPQQWWMPGE